MYGRTTGGTCVLVLHVETNSERFHKFAHMYTFMTIYIYIYDQIDPRMHDILNKRTLLKQKKCGHIILLNAFIFQNNIWLPCFLAKTTNIVFC
jgi:hypothetical protein